LDEFFDFLSNYLLSDSAVKEWTLSCIGTSENALRIQIWTAESGLKGKKGPGL